MKIPTAPADYIYCNERLNFRYTQSNVFIAIAGAPRALIMADNFIIVDMRCRWVRYLRPKLPTSSPTSPSPAGPLPQALWAGAPRGRRRDFRASSRGVGD